MLYTWDFCNIVHSLYLNIEIEFFFEKSIYYKNNCSYSGGRSWAQMTAQVCTDRYSSGVHGQVYPGDLI